jgi:voltage-gated potassium channel
VDDRAHAMQRRLEPWLLVAALLTIPAIVLEETNVGSTIDALGAALNWLIWATFLAEIVIMVRVSPRPAEWLRSHPLEIAIVLLTPPFLPAALQATRVFRLLRLLRLVSAGFITRRLLSTEGIRDAGVLALVTIIGGGAAYAAVESGHNGQHLSTWDGVWWAMSTVTTVGYGDLYPRTTDGRIIAIVVMLVGIGFIAILTAAAAERFIRSQGDIQHEQEEIEREQAEIQEEERELEAGQRSIDVMLAEILERLERIESSGPAGG